MSLNFRVGGAVSPLHGSAGIKLNLGDPDEEEMWVRWAPGDVSHWIGTVLRLPQYSEAFECSEIDGPTLLELDEVVMERDLFIINPIHRKKIIAHVKLLRRRPMHVGCASCAGGACRGVPCRAFDPPSLADTPKFLASCKREDPAPENAFQGIGDDNCSAGSSGNTGCASSTAPSGSSHGLANFGSTGSSSSHSLQNTGNSRALQLKWCEPLQATPSPSCDAVESGTSLFATRFSEASREEAFDHGQADHSLSSRTLSLMTANIEMNLAGEEPLVASKLSSPPPDAAWHPSSFRSVPQAIFACSGDRNQTPGSLGEPPAPHLMQHLPAGTLESSTPVCGSVFAERKNSADAESPPVAMPLVSFSIPPLRLPASPSRCGAAARCCNSAGSLGSSDTGGHTYGSFVATRVAALSRGQTLPSRPTVTAPSQRAAVSSHFARPGGLGTLRRSRSGEGREARIFYDARFLPGASEGGSAASKERSKRVLQQPKPELARQSSPRKRVTSGPGAAGPRHGGGAAPFTPRGGAGAGSCAGAPGGAGSGSGNLAAAGGRAQSPKRSVVRANGNNGSGGCGASAAPPLSPRARSLGHKHQQPRSPPRTAQSQITPRGRLLGSRNTAQPG